MNVMAKNYVIVLGANEHKKLRDYCNCWPVPPIFILSSTIIEIVLFYVLESNENLIYDPDKRSEVWRFMSYSLVHNSPIHLWSNVIVNFMLGMILELIHKAPRVATVYLSGVLLGCLGHSVFQPMNSLLGASAGVFALWTAQMSNLILNWNEIRNNWFYASFWIIIATVKTAVEFSEGNQMISVWSHAFGGIAGFLVGMFILWNMKVHKFELRMQWAAIVLYVVLVIVCIIINLIR